ncbi:MAG: VWA-like domain-containing protein, partial [Fimbriimonadales bacterium]|nr:VWA-like domain-containing protein [Fimbriimonadales bacterium]
STEGEGEIPRADAGSSLSEGAFHPRFWDDGSGVHGQPRPWEVSSESAEVPSLTDFDRASLREEVARRILESAKERGDVPAGWVRWAKEVYKPKVNWRERLKRVLRGAITQGFGQRLDYSFRRPHRRSGIYHPFVFPSLHGERRFHIACVVDTSGSMSDEDLSQAMAEVRGVLELMRVRVTVIPCDAVPYEAVEVLTRSDWVKSLKELKGGGGTDMVAGLRSALLLKPKPEAVLVLTDGLTPYPGGADGGHVCGVGDFGESGDRGPTPTALSSMVITGYCADSGWEMDSRWG